MIRNDSRGSKRSAFTLVELLVVILIIAILVSLLAAGVMKAMQKIPEVQTRTEISQLSVGLQAFMSDYNLSKPPPSTLILYENTSLYATNPAASHSYSFLQSVFGKNLIGTGAPNFWVDWNGDGQQDGPSGPNTPWILQGQQCLTFYLGGIPNTAAMATGMPPGPQGFSSNNMNPGLPGGKRKGPYFTFQPSRLKPGLGGFFYYIDPWQTKSGPFYATLGGTPYAYFSSYGINNGYSILDCSGLIYTDALGHHFALPYWIGTSGTTLMYTNSNTYQILSAGKDGMYGYNPTPGLLPQPNNFWSPASGAIGTAADDQANFSGSLLGAGQS